MGRKAVVHVDQQPGQLVESQVPAVRAESDRAERRSPEAPAPAVVGPVPDRVPPSWSGPDGREDADSGLETPMTATGGRPPPDRPPVDRARSSIYRQSG